MPCSRIVCFALFVALTWAIPCIVASLPIDIGTYRERRLHGCLDQDLDGLVSVSLSLLTFHDPWTYHQSLFCCLSGNHLLRGSAPSPPRDKILSTFSSCSPVALHPHSWQRSHRTLRHRRSVLPAIPSHWAHDHSRPRHSPPGSRHSHSLPPRHIVILCHIGLCLIGACCLAWLHLDDDELSNFVSWPMMKFMAS